VLINSHYAGDKEKTPQKHKRLHNSSAVTTIKQRSFRRSQTIEQLETKEVKFEALTTTGGRNCSFWLWCRMKSMRPTRKIPRSHQIHPGSRRRDGRRYSGARLRILPPNRSIPQDLSWLVELENKARCQPHRRQTKPSTMARRANKGAASAADPGSG
jgi:hypothetical protein